jgi:hypothetical protein
LDTSQTDAFKLFHTAGNQLLSDFKEKTMNTEMFDVMIPFPAWDGISKVNAVCNELRRDEIFAGVPTGTPRRITMKAKKIQSGFDHAYPLTT